MTKARTRDNLHAFDKLTRVVDGQRRIISDPPLVQPIDELYEGMERDQIHDFVRAVIRSYRLTLQSDRRHLLEDFRLGDMARKVVGVGSVGTRAWIVLMLGRDDTDPLFLQAKEANASVLEEFVGRSDRRSHGERVVHGQHLMQASSDIFLGWDHGQGVDGVERDFYVRQLRDWKGAALVEAMNPATMAIYARLCASALVRAHARSGDRIAIASYLGSGERLRPGPRRVRRGLRRPERTGLRRPRSSRKERPHHRPTRHLTRPRHRPGGTSPGKPDGASPVPSRRTAARAASTSGTVPSAPVDSGGDPADSGWARGPASTSGRRQSRPRSGRRRSNPTT